MSSLSWWRAHLVESVGILMLLACTNGTEAPCMRPWAVPESATWVPWSQETGWKDGGAWVDCDFRSLEEPLVAH